MDSKSSVNVFNNNKYITRIHKAKKLLKLHFNAECVQINQKGWFSRIEVWYHPKGITNIFSLKTLKQHHHVTDDSQDKGEAMLGYPSKKDFESMVYANFITNCPVTPENVAHAYKHFSVNVTGLKGKTVCQELEQVVVDYF